VRIALLVAALNGLDVVTADIQNAYIYIYIYIYGYSSTITGERSSSWRRMLGLTIFNRITTIVGDDVNNNGAFQCGPADGICGFALVR
jgi:hypothetical protein